MKRMTRIAAAAAGLALVGGVAFATPALADSTPTPTDGTTTSCHWAVQLWDELPQNLRTDLRDAAHTRDATDRRGAFEAIRTKALAGDYGDVAKQLAEAHHGLGVGVWRNAPKDLRDDLKAALAKTGDDRTQAFAAIGSKALSGGYGDAVKALAEQAQNESWWPDCKS